jgi:magnesium chelatase family protein
MTPAQVRRFATLDRRGREALAEAYERDFVSARGHDRVLRVARTVADLNGRDRIDARDVHQAIGFRTLQKSVGEVAA